MSHVSLYSQEGRTPLHYSAALHDSGIFYRYLLKCGADENIQDKVINSTFLVLFFKILFLSTGRRPNFTCTLLVKSTWMFWLEGARKCPGRGSPRGGPKCSTLYHRKLWSRRHFSTQIHQRARLKKSINGLFHFFLPQLWMLKFWRTWSGNLTLKGWKTLFWMDMGKSFWEKMQQTTK